MSIYKELSYDQYIDVVRGIQFGVLSPEEIERRSVVEVKKTDTYSGTDPIVDGLFDPRMGVLEHSRVCATCEQKNNFCPGHFGHIKLARPVFHAMFFDHIKRLLKCVCYRCSRILVSETSTHVDIRDTVKKAQALKNLEKRNAIMFKLCSNNNKLKKCGDGNPGGCNCRQPNKYYKENALKIMAEWKEQGMQPERKEFTPEEILRIFQRISEKDMEVLGFNPKWNRPEWMICTVLPVPPPSVRPSIIEENGQRREDDLTHKLCDIIKTNNQLKQRIERGNATEEQLRLTSMVLQYHVATFVDNQLPGIPPAQQRNGRRLKSLCDRLKKKEGRIRGNLNGKRVDQSARSVITPDPYISLDELGVPIKVALNLTFPETVNALNKEHLQKLVRTGPDVWPGAKYVRKASNGNTFSLRLSPEKRDEIAGELHEGDIVDRHLSDGDYVLFNRQPSLHKMSMMCHRVKVMPYNTFRLNVLVTSPYNADFDGDEMNTHCPQSLQTMCELMDFAAVPYHTITPKDAQPIIEVVQDTMLGAYRLTKSHVRMPDKVLANLQMVNSYFKGMIPQPDDKEANLFTGRQAYSMVLPPSLYLKAKNKLGETVTIEDSIITDGIIDKKAYTAMSKGILPILFHDYGPFEVRRFMDNTQRLICRWLVTAGFSVGISDLIIPDSIHNSIKEKIQEKKLEAYKRIDAVRKGDIANTSMLNNHDFLESEIVNILNELNSKIGTTVSDTLDDNINRLVNMVKSGSKGKPQNVAQMIANVGQQNVDGKRVAYGFTDRTLPHYSKYDDGPEARGFVENSFISGLTPQEVFFHAMGGREGLIDTAVKTSETGYIQRRLVKAMEDAKVYYDQTVRNASGNIVQFIYGEDGMEGTKIEVQSYPILNMTTFDMEQTYHLRPEDNIERYLSAEGKKTLKKEKKWVDRCAEHFQQLLEDRERVIVDVFHKSNDITLLYPIPFSRIIENADKRAKSICATAFPTDLTPEYVLDKMEALKKNLYVIENQGVFFLHVLLHVHLSPKVMIYKYRFSKSMFDWIVSEIERYFHEAVAPPGEMVGIIAAQSMGEPATQLSTSKDTTIRITAGKDNTKYSYTGKIGTFIDRLLAENTQDVIDLGNNSSALYLKDDYYIIGVSNEEKTSWRRILEVSRHPANGGMVTVHTKSGRKTTATLSHSFLKRTPNGIEPVEGAKLKVGDFIPVTRKIPMIENAIYTQWIGNKSMTLDKDFGWLLGAYLADGNINGTTLSVSKTDPVFEERLRAFCLNHGYMLRVREHTGTIDMDVRYADRTYTSKTMTICGTEAIHFAKWVLQNFSTGSYQKSIPAWVYASNKEFIAGIVSGYFDGDGNVNVERQMVRAHSVNSGLIEDMSILLNYCGIFATMHTESRKREKANKFHVLTLNRKYASVFKETIGFYVSHKSENLDKIIEYNARENVHSVQEMIDQIPECGESIAYIGERLALPGQSRLYKRWLKKKAIGRRTLEKYVALFKATNDLSGNLPDVADHISKLEQALQSDVVWDEIVELEYLADPQEYVYDFTVPGNDSFMVDNGVLVHNTLDSFHVSGTAAAVKATSGVPRLKELLSVSKNIKTPSLTIYLKKEVGTVVDPIQEEGDDGQTMSDPRVSELKDRALHIRNQMEITRLSYVLDSTEVFWDPPGDDGFDTAIEEDKQMLALYREFEDVAQCYSTSPWVLRMKINKEKLHDCGLTMMDVYMKLYEAYSLNMECLFSDDNAEELIFRIRLTNEKESKKKTEEAEEDEGEEVLNEMEDDSVASLKALEHNIVHNLILKGIPGIKKVSMRSNERKEYSIASGQFHTLKEWIMQTDGSNLLDILCNPNVDATRTVSNDVWEIFQAYGIEAARTALYNEIMDVIRESSVNYRHISLLIDTMTVKGSLMSIDRHGINRGDVGPLAKSSFEETTDMLINAGVFSDYDKINGVSANIMLGQLPPCGTGDSEILMDEEGYLAILRERAQKKKKTAQSPPPPMIPDVPNVNLMPPCDVTELVFDHKLPKKTRTKLRMDLPDAPF
jgi:DNA-directed RNA polymerase beta' subunit